MIPAIQRFLERLRAAGVAASPAEAIDAFRAVRAVGLEDRAAFRAALRATVAKDREAQRLFDAHFDDYFRPPARAGKRGKGESAGAGAGEGRGGAGAGGGRPRAEPPEEERRPARGRPRARAREEERPPRVGASAGSAACSRAATGPRATRGAADPPQRPAAARSTSRS
jgi:uncharacterized protein with von Willebrand factor type A (vWA) domain